MVITPLVSVNCSAIVGSSSTPNDPYGTAEEFGSYHWNDIIRTGNGVYNNLKSHRRHNKHHCTDYITSGNQCACHISDNETHDNGANGNTADGNTADGNTADGDTTDSDATDGNTTDGNTTDGNTTDSDATDGNTTDSDAIYQACPD